MAAARSGSSPRSGDPRRRNARRPPVCNRTHDGKTCRQRGEHLCKPRADHVSAFFRELLVHTKGKWARQVFELEQWQADEIVRPVFGTVWWDPEEQGYVRRFTIVWIEVARKNGKSELLAGIALYLLVADGEESAEVYGCAKDKDQARKVFDVAKRMVELSPVLSRRLSIQNQAKRIYDLRTASYYEAVPADAAGNLGHNPHGIVFDEILTQPNGDLWTALETAMGSRAQPLMVAATTAGDNPDSFAHGKHEDMVRILEDPTRSPRTFVYIRNVPKDADPWDESLWARGNPALGTFLKLSILRAEAHEARENVRKENAFRQFRLNQWVRQTTRYVSMDEWAANVGERGLALTPDHFADQLTGEVCWAGLDLSSKLDVTAWTLLFADGSIIWRFWLPERAVEMLDKRNEGKVGAWVKDGWITATEGDVIDYEQVYATIEADAERFAIATITYDKWSGEPVRQAIQERCGFDDGQMVESSTTYDKMTAPMREFERTLKARQFQHAGNPVAAWMADSLEAKSPTDDPDRVRPVKPDRGKTGKRIDGMVSLVLAVDGRLTVEAEELPEADIF